MDKITINKQPKYLDFNDYLRQNMVPHLHACKRVRAN